MFFKHFMVILIVEFFYIRSIHINYKSTKELGTITSKVYLLGFLNNF